MCSGWFTKIFFAYAKTFNSPNLKKPKTVDRNDIKFKRGNKKWLIPHEMDVTYIYVTQIGI